MSKPLVLRTLRITGAYEVARLAARHRLVALTYHKVLPDDMRAPNRPENVVYTSEFAEHVAYLRRRHHVLTGDELRAAVRGQTPLPAHAALITFDDGFLNNYTQALPVLRDAGVTAVFFVCTDFLEYGAPMWFDRVDSAYRRFDDAAFDEWTRTVNVPPPHRTRPAFRRWMKALPARERDAWVARLDTDAPRPSDLDPRDTCAMTWQQAREMADAGMTIGSHTVGHVILATAPPDDVRHEVTASRLAIEARLGCPCWCFAYPNGQPTDFRESDKRRLGEAGYECAFTQIPGFADPAYDPFALRRIEMPGSSNRDVFRSRITGAHFFLSQLAQGRSLWRTAVE